MDDIKSERDDKPWFVEAEDKPIKLNSSRMPLSSCGNVMELIEIHPGSVYFEGFQPGKEYVRTIRVVNVSPNAQRIYCYAPVTKWFKIISQNNPVDIHLHGFSSVPSIDFPSFIFLPPTNLGECYKCCLNIKCNSPVNLEFELNLRPPDSSLTFHPMKGLLLASGENITVTLTYTPQIISPVTTILNLSVQNFPSLSFNCKVSTIVPDTKRAETEIGTKVESGTRPKHMSMTSLKEEKIPQAKYKSVFSRKSNDPKNIEYKRGKVPFSHVHTLGALKAIKQSKVKHEEKSVVQICDAIKLSSRDIELNQFLEEFEKFQEEEKRCLVHWHQRLGADPLTYEEKQEIITKRQALSTAEGSKFDLKRISDFNETKYLFKRTVRDVPQKIESRLVPLNLSQDQDWKYRLMNYNRLRKAVWKVIVRIRAQNRLQKMKKYFEEEEWQNKGIIQAMIKWLPSDASEINVDPFAKTIHLRSNKDIDILHPDLHLVPKSPIVSEEHFPLQSIPINEPKFYEYFGYTMFDVYKAREDYLPPAPPYRYPDHKCPLERWFEIGEEEREEEEERNKKLDDISSPSLSPPVALLENYKYKAASIFNPNPLLDVYFPLPSTHEFDVDYMLHPLVPWTFQNKTIYLDPKEVIKGAMTWDKFTFPSESFLNRQTVPTLPFSAIPRVQPQKDSHLIPMEGPPLKTGLSPEDEQIIQEILRSSGDSASPMLEDPKAIFKNTPEEENQILKNIS